MSLSRWRDTAIPYQYGAHRIATHVHGAGPEALLLLHGFPSASWDYEAMWGPLCKRFDHVITLDLLGFGFSDKPRRHRYSLLEQTELCVSLLRERGVERVHLLAHDYGVSIAQEWLARAADRARQRAPEASGLPEPVSCVFLNGGLFPEAHRPLFVQRLLRSPLGGAVVGLLSALRFNRTFSRLFGPQTQPGVIELYDYRVLIGTHHGWRVLPRLLRYLDERRKYRGRWVGAISAPRQPLRLISGEADPVAGAATVARYRQLVPSADVVTLPGIGHYPHVEAPDRVLRAFFAFHDALRDAGEC